MAPEQVVASFVAIAGDPAFSGHVSVRAAMDIGPIAFVFESVSDFAGPDQTAESTIEVAGQAVTTEVVIAGGRMFVRLPGGQWQVLPTAPPESGDPVFSRLDGPEDVVYLKQQRVGTRTLHRVRIVDALPIDPGEVANTRITDLQVGEASFEILVDDEGKPVLGYFDLEGTAAIEGVRQAILIDADYRFTRIGEAITIEAPI